MPIRCCCNDRSSSHHLAVLIEHEASLPLCQIDWSMTIHCEDHLTRSSEIHGIDTLVDSALGRNYESLYVANLLIAALLGVKEESRERV